MAVAWAAEVDAALSTINAWAVGKMEQSVTASVTRRLYEV